MESAVNTIPPSEETVAKLQPLASGATPLALEIAVNVAGARPASASAGQRDLFSEDTATVLISENGAVVRLAAAVVTGQLLFLTDKRTNSEMVCQVVRKRIFRPMECYVELEFTEPAPNFWGLEIPARTASPSQLATAQRVESAETTVEDPPAKTPAAQGKGVAELKQEVEALREQLQSLPQAKAQAAKAEAEAALQQSAKRAEAAAAERSRIKPAAAPPAPPAAAPPPPPNPPAVAAAPTDGKAPGAGAEAAPDVAAKPLVRMALPKMTPAKEGGAKDSEVIDPLDCLLPKPDLDFSAAPAPGATNERRSPHDIYKPLRARIGKFRLALLIGVLIGVVLSGAWYMDWLRVPSLGRSAQLTHLTNSKKVESGSARTVTTKPAGETSPLPVGSAVKAADVPDTEAPPTEASAPASPAALKTKKTEASAISPGRASAEGERRGGRIAPQNNGGCHTLSNCTARTSRAGSKRRSAGAAEVAEGGESGLSPGCDAGLHYRRCAGGCAGRTRRAHWRHESSGRTCAAASGGLGRTQAI